MQKQTSSKIDFEKEFDLQPIGKKEEVKNAPSPEEVKQLIQYAEQKILYNKKLVKNMFNAEFFPRGGEINNKPSLTIPDQTLPIKELLARFAKGLPVGVKVPVYEGEENDMPDPKRLDLVDLQELKEAAKSELKAIADRQKKRDTKVSPEQKEVKEEETNTI